jgi:hypothetical protein
LDRNIINRQGKEIGEVKDLIFDLTHRKVDKIIIAVSEDIFGKEKFVAAPYKQLGFSSYSVVYEGSIKEIRNLPEYSHPVQ